MITIPEPHRAEKQKKRGDYWLTKEGRAELKECFTDPNDGNAVRPLLDALEKLEEKINDLKLEEIEAECNVINFTGTTTMDIPCERIIAGLSGKVFERIMVIGFIEGIENIYVASHSSEIGDLLLLIERAKYFLLHDAESV